MTKTGYVISAKCQHTFHLDCAEKQCRMEGRCENFEPEPLKKIKTEQDALILRNTELKKNKRYILALRK